MDFNMDLFQCIKRMKLLQNTQDLQGYRFIVQGRRHSPYEACDMLWIWLVSISRGSP